MKTATNQTTPFGAERLSEGSAMLTTRKLSYSFKDRRSGVPGISSSPSFRMRSPSGPEGNVEVRAGGRKRSYTASGIV